MKMGRAYGSTIFAEPVALCLRELIYLAGINSSPTISTELYNISRADGFKTRPRGSKYFETLDFSPLRKRDKSQK
jgi:hypothetical protein